MTDFDASEEPTDLPATGRGLSSDSMQVQSRDRPSGGLHPRLGAQRRSPSGLRPAVARPPLESAPRRAGGADAVLRRSSIAVLRYLDVALILLAAPFALSLGAPALGYAIGVAAWVAQHVIAHADRRWIRQTTAPRTQLGLNLFEAFARIWLLAAAIIAAALAGGRADGLTASLVIFAAYTVAFAVRVITGPPQGKALR
jgi:hypothetical protein